MSRKPCRCPRITRRAEPEQALLRTLRSVLEIQTAQHRQIEALSAAVRELQDIAIAAGSARPWVAP